MNARPTNSNIIVLYKVSQCTERPHWPNAGRGGSCCVPFGKQAVVLTTRLMSCWGTPYSHGLDAWLGIQRCDS